VDAGCLVTVATGSSYAIALPIARALGVDLPLLLGDGTIRRALHDGAMLNLYPLPPTTLGTLIRRVASYALQPIVDWATLEQWVATGPAELDPNDTSYQ